MIKSIGNIAGNVFAASMILVIVVSMTLAAISIVCPSLLMNY